MFTVTVFDCILVYSKNCNIGWMIFVTDTCLLDDDHWTSALESLSTVPDLTSPAPCSSTASGHKSTPQQNRKKPVNIKTARWWASCLLDNTNSYNDVLSFQKTVCVCVRVCAVVFFSKSFSCWLECPTWSLQVKTNMKWKVLWQTNWCFWLQIFF